MKGAYFIRGLSCILLLIMGCGKDIVGPTTDSPFEKRNVNAPEIGSLAIYSTWEDFKSFCDSIPVEVDNLLVGYISSFSSSNLDCNEAGAVTVDSLQSGSHKVSIGNCDFIFWEMDVIVFNGQCTSVPVNK